MPGLPVHQQLLEFTQTHVHHISEDIQPSHPLSSPSPAFNLSQQQGILRIRWPKYWSFNFSINCSSEYSGLISFRIDWLDLLTVQGTLKSPPTPQFHSINSSAFSFLYGPTVTSIHTRKTIALTSWTFVGKAMSLLFNMLSRLIRAFLPRIQHLNFKAAVTICNDFGGPTPQK